MHNRQYSVMKKNEIMPITATQIDLLSEVSPTEKDKYQMTQLNLFIKQTVLQTQNMNLWLPGGLNWGEGEDRLGVWD